MSSGWNQRFSGEGYYYGTAPADFVVRQAARLDAGARVLSVAEGEGRNAIYLARQGFDVTAFDGSDVALAKARALAAGQEPAPEFHLCRAEDWRWQAGAYDAVFAVFTQFAPPALRAVIFEGIVTTLRPGGLVLLHGFATRQLENHSGGPRDPAHLYTLDLLHVAFAGWQIEEEADYDAELREGAGHSGRAALIDFVARKP